MADGQIGGMGDEAKRRLRYVDMTLGAWRPREAARQLLAGLGQPRAAELLSPVAITGGLIDLEADADPVIAAAHEDATRIGERLPTGTVVVVLAPLYGEPVRAENEWFFLFLRRLGFSVAIVGEPPGTSVSASTPFERRRGIESPEWSGAWPPGIPVEGQRLLRFFPGLLPRELADKHGLAGGLAALVPVGPGHFLIPAGYRDVAPRDGARDFDLMGEIEAVDDGFRVFSQCHCNAHFADATMLAALAQEKLLAGGLELASALLDRARVVARNPDEAGLVDLIRQEARLFERRFAEAAKVPDPSRRAPAAVASRTRRLRGFAAASIGDVAAAERDLSHPLARLAAEEKLSTDDLYMLDTLARARLGAGDAERAAGLARAIEASLARDPDADTRMALISHLTAAATARGQGDARAERVSLARAFAPAVGVRHLAEIVELNIAEARAGRDKAAIGLAWLRAIFAWLAIDPSEAFGTRAARTVLGREPSNRTQMDTEVSQSLTEALRKAGLELVTAPRARLPAIRASERDRAIEPERLLAAPGIGFLWTPVTVVTPIYAPARGRLLHVALGAFGELCPASRAIETGTLVIDTNLGIDLPRNLGDAVTVAERGGVGEIVFGRETIMLPAGERRRRIVDFQVSLSPSVAAVDTVGGEVIVRYRRNLADRRLTKEEFDLIAPLRTGAQISLGALAMTLARPVEALEPAFRRLEAARLVRVDAAGPAAAQPRIAAALDTAASPAPTEAKPGAPQPPAPPPAVSRPLAAKAAAAAAAQPPTAPLLHEDGHPV